MRARLPSIDIGLRYGKGCGHGNTPTGLMNLGRPPNGAGTGCGTKLQCGVGSLYGRGVGRGLGASTMRKGSGFGAGRSCSEGGVMSDLVDAGHGDGSGGDVDG